MLTEEFFWLRINKCFFLTSIRLLVYRPISIPYKMYVQWNLNIILEFKKVKTDAIILLVLLPKSHTVRTDFPACNWHLSFSIFYEPYCEYRYFWENLSVTDFIQFPSILNKIKSATNKNIDEAKIIYIDNLLTVNWSIFVSKKVSKLLFYLLEAEI